MPSEKNGIQQAGWRGDDTDNDDERAGKKHTKKHNRATVVAPSRPATKFKSKTAVVVAGGASPAATTTKPTTEGNEGGSSHHVPKDVLNSHGHSSKPSSKVGASRRKENGLYQAAVVQRISKQLVKETRKKIVAREKAEENEFKRAQQEKQNNAAAATPGTQKVDEEESDEGDDPAGDGGWLRPDTRAARRSAKQMRGLRTNSVDYLEYDDLHHLSAARPFVKSGGIRCPNPFGRKLIEERQELLRILNLPRNKRMRKAGIKESHLASLVDVYRDVMSNALVRNEEDEAGDAGPLAEKKPKEKGVRVSWFAATLGISPYLFMREILWASNRLYAHSIPGEMNRATWVFGCLSLCLMSEKELVEFIFSTCKVTEVGELEMGELDRLARSLHLSNDTFWPAFSQQLEDIIKSHQNGNLIMTLDFFLDMHHKFPMILYPALRVQELVQRRTLGLHTWGRLNNRLDNFLVKQKRMANSKPCCLWVLFGFKK